jgi:hypothetical protein
MNGYLRALQRIVPPEPEAAATAGDGQVVSLQEWVRTMSRNGEKAEANVQATIDSGRAVSSAPSVHRAETNAEAMAGQVRMLDPAVSFVLNVLFDRNRAKVEVRIARALFRPSASIVLIPRDRPTLACVVGVDEFFAADRDILQCEDGWEETLRIHDPCVDPGARARIRAHILMDARISPAKPRRIDVIFALRNVSTAQRIHSCTIVYDETPRLRSPVTLFG